MAVNIEYFFEFGGWLICGVMDDGGGGDFGSGVDSAEVVLGMMMMIMKMISVVVSEALGGRSHNSFNSFSFRFRYEKKQTKSCFTPQT